MARRERLPNRRKAELRDFTHDNRRWTLTVGRFDDGRVAEVFLDAPKTSPIAEMAQDISLIASVALQCGAPVQTLRHALRGRDNVLEVALSLIEAGDF
jgi:hypothetical protein